MNAEFDAAIARLQEKLRTQETQVADTKRLINLLLVERGDPPLYTDVGGPSASTAITPDRFYGQPLATAVRDILQMRKAAGLSAADTDTIFAALKAGGFQFEVDDEVAAKRGVAISLSKNAVVFHRVPSGAWGLTDWYPDVAAKKRRQGKPADAPVTTNPGDATSATEQPTVKSDKAS